MFSEMIINALINLIYFIIIVFALIIAATIYFLIQTLQATRHRVHFYAAFENYKPSVAVKLYHYTGNDNGGWGQNNGGWGTWH